MNAATKKRHIRKFLGAHAPEIAGLSDAIAALAEPGFEEVRSARLLDEYLTRNAFTVEYPWPHMPTAFRATRGRGRPRLAVLAEYDALPGCGPKKDSWGHGCGHNLLGAAAAAGAVTAATVLETAGSRASITVWGCPAEEILAGKVYMARDGAFRDDDAIIAWHPSSKTQVGRLGGSALDSLVFEFRGRTAHAAGAPEGGRSALDAVMLMDVAVNYLREHVPENVRIHMSIPSGGEAPNVVPAYASAWYYVRAKDRAQVDDMRARVIDCARGAALATGTKVSWKRLTGGYNRLENDPMGDLVEKNLALFGMPEPTRQDARAARALGAEPEFATEIEGPERSQGRASSDEDTVSWLAPLGRFSMACWPKGVRGHHRQTAQHAVLPYAHRGMLRAAEVIAASLFDLASDRTHLKKSRDEFRARTKGFTYDPLVKKKQAPPSARQ